jgi:hypothetical protein
MRNKCYSIGGKNVPRVASAFAPDTTPLSYQLIDELDGITELPFEMELVKLSDGKNRLIKSSDLSDLKTIWLDYQPNSLAWPLMSETMKHIIEKHLTGNEGIDWISAKIKNNTESKYYHIPRFNKMLDVLDTEKTKFINGRVIKPYFSLLKIDNLSMFHKPTNLNLWKITPQLYVTEEIKTALQKAQITGIEFDEVLAG